MLAQQHGVIINTASVAGLVGLKDSAAYCARTPGRLAP
jgi:NADP-dependent 3-hydroxy acid dehydrogenase YdfG